MAEREASSPLFVPNPIGNSSNSFGDTEQQLVAHRRKVLIDSPDVFGSVGGGQKVYQELIHRNPDTTFYYWGFDESDSAPRPANAELLRYRQFYDTNWTDLPAEASHFYSHYGFAWNMACLVRATLGRCHLDVLDVPDYSDRGLFLRGALEQHGVSVGKLAVALHGTLKTHYLFGWPGRGGFSRQLAELRVRVHLQYRAADVRYAVSESYAQQWKHYSGIEANLIDPMAIVGASNATLSTEDDALPDVVFIGRMERFKGPDVFVDLAWCLKEGTYRQIIMLGGESPGPTGVKSTDVLQGMALKRKVVINLSGNGEPEAIKAAFRRRSIIVVSSRADTLNLVAMEALAAGCPVFVSEKAGVAHWIRTKYPELSDLIVDFECSRTAADAVRDALTNYDEIRGRVVNALRERPYRPDFSSLTRTYDGPNIFDVRARQTIADIQSRFDSFNRPISRDKTCSVALGASFRLPDDFRNRLRNNSQFTRANNELNVTQKVVRKIRKQSADKIARYNIVASFPKPASQKDVNELRRSGLFDEVFYLRSYPDVAALMIDPIRHYLEVGSDERRNPHPLFDTSWYLKQYPHVAQSGSNPLLHYITDGGPNGANPSPLFHGQWYLERNPDALTGWDSPLLHYLNSGALEMCDPNPLFSTRWYLEQNPALLAEGMNPLVHYVLLGALEHKDPHPLFSTSWYLAQTPEVAADDFNSLIHYLEAEGGEERSPHPLFDARWYMERNPGVDWHRMRPLVHYLLIGAREGRDPHPNFDSDCYLAARPEVANGNANPLVHFVSTEATQVFDSARLVKSSQGTFKSGSFDLGEGAKRWVQQTESFDRIRERLLKQGERTRGEISQKLSDVGGDLWETKLGRAAIFRDMVRLARKRGEDLVAATYCLRLMRWLGRDHYRDLEFVVDALRRYGFGSEATVAAAMFSDPAQSESRCRAILDTQEKKNLIKPDLPFAILDDRRTPEQPKVSVIVSLYNAEAKLLPLLNNIAIQSLSKAHRVEIVLIDSNSPTREYEIFKRFAGKRDISIVYARSEQRETIQAAWNRGINLARAPYLCFLGADEGLHPDCLELLSATLDARPDIDWVMADSIVTDVDRNGAYVADVMAYDRSGYRQSLVTLETCYLSWVGGLYRKSIHTRFGYYDETFRAAGDTEFKGRILGKIKTLHVPRTLGVFNNYPEERTTQSPAAEIEDLRAWYLHRTTAGLGYAFDATPLEDVKELFRFSLAYRKSYCSHLSTDFDLAFAAASYMQSRPDRDGFADEAFGAAHRLVEMLRQIEMLDFGEPSSNRAMQVELLLRHAKAIQSLDEALFSLERMPEYGLFNDNRFEQHWWPWQLP